MEPVTAIFTAGKVLEVGGTLLGKTVFALYEGSKEVGKGAVQLNAFIDSHIATLVASGDPTIASTGRVLEQSKKGLFYGYATPVVLIATGHLLLGNPLSAGGELVSALTLTNPVASTCAAIGAIWFGWNALGEKEKEAICGKLSEGFQLSLDVVRQIVDFGRGLLKSIMNSRQIEALEGFIRAVVAETGRSFYSITGKMRDLFSRDAGCLTFLDRDRSLTDVLQRMDLESELSPLLGRTLKSAAAGRGLTHEATQAEICRELSAAASYSLPWAVSPSYDDAVRIVARNLKLPARAELSVEEIERAILFKVLERAIERLGEKDRGELVKSVQDQLHAQGVSRNVSYKELLGFVKTAGMDVGGTVGTFALVAPGLSGAIGLNVLQVVVLKGILFTSGYMAAGGALLGLGAGGTALGIAGLAGPIGAALGGLYAAYSLAGPAYRKLVPTICVVGAKRLSLQAEDPPTSPPPGFAR